MAYKVTGKGAGSIMPQELLQVFHHTPTPGPEGKKAGLEWEERFPAAVTGHLPPEPTTDKATAADVTKENY